MKPTESLSVRPSTEAVEQELARILASAQFINSGRLSALPRVRRSEEKIERRYMVVPNPWDGVAADAVLSEKRFEL